MRIPILFLPSLMLLGVVFALHCEALPAANTRQNSVDVGNEQALRQEQQAISERLSRLRAERQRMLPRGGI